MSKIHSTSYNGCGIYALYNMKKYKIYIGRSSSIKKRLLSHCAHFKNKDVVINSMYGDCIDDFVFVVIYKLSKDAYEAYGLMYENACMYQFTKWNVELYNKSPKCKSKHDFLHMIGAQFVFASYIPETVAELFCNKTGVRPYMIQCARSDWTERVTDYINDHEGNQTTQSTEEPL